MRWATFVAPGGAEIQLMEPGPDTPLGRRLATHGEHVHHICFTTDDSRRTIGGCARAPHHRHRLPGPEHAVAAVRLGAPGQHYGTLVEVARPYKAVDGRWQDASA